MQRAMEAFASMDIDAAKRCLGIVETTAEFFPKAENTKETAASDLRHYKSNGKAMFPVIDHYSASETTKAPLSGAIGITRLTKPESRLDLN